MHARSDSLSHLTCCLSLAAWYTARTIHLVCPFGRLPALALPHACGVTGVIILLPGDLHFPLSLRPGSSPMLFGRTDPGPALISPPNLTPGGVVAHCTGS